jgi:Phosphodiesterase/alkaline phosphatase D
LDLLKKRVQIILLDVRTFRKPAEVEGPEIWNGKDYAPDTAADADMLGEAQWAWLEERLQDTAVFRLICSGTQFASEFNGKELWALYPAEKQRMLDLLVKTQAEGVVFLTGDVHLAEISKQPWEGPYSLYDFTSSGMNTFMNKRPPNKYRVGKGFYKNNFGLLTFDWEADSPRLTFRAINRKGKVKLEHTLTYKELRWNAQQNPTETPAPREVDN